MFGFPERFDGCEVVTLDQNYRSIPPILDAANAMLDRAPQALPAHAVDRSQRRPSTRR